MAQEKELSDNAHTVWILSTSIVSIVMLFFSVTYSAYKYESKNTDNWETIAKRNAISCGAGATQKKDGRRNKSTDDNQPADRNNSNTCPHQLGIASLWNSSPVKRGSSKNNVC
jgi:hypothetical protein